MIYLIRWRRCLPKSKKTHVRCTRGASICEIKKLCQLFSKNYEKEGMLHFWCYLESHCNWAPHENCNMAWRCFNDTVICPITVTRNSSVESLWLHKTTSQYLWTAKYCHCARLPSFQLEGNDSQKHHGFWLLLLAEKMTELCCKVYSKDVLLKGTVTYRNQNFI